MALARRVGNDYNNIHIEGGRTILLDDKEFRQFAVQNKISVIALGDRTVSEAAA